MKSDIKTRNNKYQYHGYQEWYFYNKLIYRGKYKNGKLVDYSEHCMKKQTRYYIR